MDLSPTDQRKYTTLQLEYQRAWLAYLRYPRPDGWNRDTTWQDVSNAAVSLNKFIRSLM